MFISYILSIAGCLITGLQTALILSKGNGICFNEGCEIVDSLTLIPPLYFNIAGFFFFLVTTIALGQARKHSELGERFASLLLLTGLAAEGVLFSFQVFISQAFCSYCLVIFGLVAVANIFMGIKQLFKGMLLFLTILATFASLDFSNGSRDSETTLDNGTMAQLSVENSSRQLYLFFSSTCTHCEKIIERLQQGTTCSINFNLSDTIT